ncbi:MAG: hypothetical protein ACQ5SW_09585 [Sphaerochaetaceae bacterium]
MEAFIAVLFIAAIIVGIGSFFINFFGGGSHYAKEMTGKNNVRIYAEKARVFGWRVMMRIERPSYYYRQNIIHLGYAFTRLGVKRLLWQWHVYRVVHYWRKSKIVELETTEHD